MGRKEKKYMDKAYLVREVKSFLMDEDGVGVIELVLILVVLIGLVIVFKSRLIRFLQISLNRSTASRRRYIDPGRTAR